MKCLYCGGEMKRGKSTYTVNRKGYHLFIQEILAYICVQCGEKYFEEEEIERIQSMIRKLEVEIDKVRNYEISKEVIRNEQHFGQDGS